MDWSNEPFVKLYTRDTADDIALSWDARGVWYELLRKVDRAGVLSLGRRGLAGLPALLRGTVEAVTLGLQDLLEDGRVEMHGNCIVIPNFIEAQKSVQNDRARKELERARRRDMARAGQLAATRKRVTEEVATLVNGCSIGRYGSSEPHETSTPKPAPVADLPHAVRATFVNDDRKDGYSTVTPRIEEKREERTDTRSAVPSLSGRKGTKRSSAHPQRAAFVARWNVLFEQRYQERPNWSPGERGAADRLLAQHGLEVVAARAERLFSAPPAWLKGALTPLSLERAWNQLAKAPAPPAPRQASPPRARAPEPSGEERQQVMSIFHSYLTKQGIEISA